MSSLNSTITIALRSNDDRFIVHQSLINRLSIVHQSFINDSSIVYLSVIFFKFTEDFKLSIKSIDILNRNWDFSSVLTASSSCILFNRNLKSLRTLKILNWYIENLKLIHLKLVENLFVSRFIFSRLRYIVFDRFRDIMIVTQEILIWFFRLSSFISFFIHLFSFSFLFFFISSLFHFFSLSSHLSFFSSTNHTTFFHLFISFYQFSSLWRISHSSLCRKEASSKAETIAKV